MLSQLGHELQETKSLQLEHVSPKLLRAHHLELAVPGPSCESRSDCYRAFRTADQGDELPAAASPGTVRSDGGEYGFLLKAMRTSGRTSA